MPTVRHYADQIATALLHTHRDAPCPHAEETLAQEGAIQIRPEESDWTIRCACGYSFVFTQEAREAVSIYSKPDWVDLIRKLVKHLRDHPPVDPKTVWDHILGEDDL